MIISYLPKLILVDSGMSVTILKFIKPIIKLNLKLINSKSIHSSSFKLNHTDQCKYSLSVGFVGVGASGSTITLISINVFTTVDFSYVMKN